MVMMVLLQLWSIPQLEILKLWLRDVGEQHPLVSGKMQTTAVLDYSLANIFVEAPKYSPETSGQMENVAPFQGWSWL